MVDVKKKGPMFLGIGAVLAGVLLLFRGKKPPGTEPPPEPPPGLAHFYGRVTDANTGEVIWLGLVMLNGMTSPTSIDGEYLFANVEPGEYTVIFTKEGYETKTQAVTLSEGNNELNVSLMPAAFNGFTLRMQNLPPETRVWNANFAENTFNYDPLADSGWLSPGASWEYPNDPLGVTTLRIWALDADNNILFDVYNLGPVNNGKHYIYDHSAGSLQETI